MQNRLELIQQNPTNTPMFFSMANPWTPWHWMQQHWLPNAPELRWPDRDLFPETGHLKNTHKFQDLMICWFYGFACTHGIDWTNQKKSHCSRSHPAPKIALALHSCAHWLAFWQACTAAPATQVFSRKMELVAQTNLVISCWFQFSTDAKGVGHQQALKIGDLNCLMNSYVKHV